MSDVRLVSLEHLRLRLQRRLGGDSLLFRRFDAALGTADEARIEAAMASLKLYPTAVQQEIESELMAWLFDDLPLEAKSPEARRRH